MTSDSLRDVIAGALGGLGCVLVGQPLDTVKVKQQTHPYVYRTMYQTFVKTLEEGGVAAFYAGCGPAIVSNVAENAVLFLCYEHCKQAVCWYTGSRHSGEMKIIEKATAGALASVFSSIVINPAERVKCILQIQEQQQREHRSVNVRGRLKYGLSAMHIVACCLCRIF